jgi:hypothetical protein
MSPPRTSARTVAALVAALLVTQVVAVPAVAAGSGADPVSGSVAGRTTDLAAPTPPPTVHASRPSVSATTSTARPVAATDRRLRGGRLGRDGAGVPTVARQTADAPVVAERYTFVRGTESGTVDLRIRYDVPPSVTAFRLRLPGLAGPSLSVVDRAGFSRRDETTFEWARSGSGSKSESNAGSSPRIDLRLAVGTDSFAPGSRGVERDGWTFATAPEVGIGVTYTGDRPRVVSTTTVEGTGYATDRMAFMGPHDVVETTVGDESVTFVVGNGTAAVNVTGARRFLDRARGRFDFGVRRDRLVVFVLPYDRRRRSTGTSVTGEAFGDAFWVTAGATRVADPRNAFAHEYVHSRLTDVGNGSAAWLTEATAEYYGYLTTLNVGGTSYDAFRRATTAERFAPNRTAVTLSEPGTWRGTLGDYEKGAHVLAALDAEIRARTGGERTLYDVFVANRTFDDHAAFRAAVVATADDESLGPWLDRYVTTDALPPVPDDPTRYVHGPDLDPDGDGLASERELDLAPRTNPFVPDTDGDGLSDGREVALGTDPTAVDTDGDTLADAHELDAGTDPTLADTDGDGTNDALDAYPTDPSAETTPSTETAGSTAHTVSGGTATAPPTSPATSTGSARANAGDHGEEGYVEAVRSRVETPGFGVAALVAAAALGGMLFRRQNRGS